MTLATGKSGRYRYYKCTRRINKGLFSSGNIPAEKLDELVLTHLVDHAFTPSRLQLMLAEARRRLTSQGVGDLQKLQKLQSDLRQKEQVLERLYAGIEAGVLELDDTLQRRVQQAKGAREALLIEMAGLRRRQALPVDRILPFFAFWTIPSVCSAMPIH